jgi:hypothetical protein
MDLWATVAAISVAILLIVMATQAQAQTLSVLHTFSGSGDGAVSTAGLTMDQAGNFYGTTSIGGAAYGTAGYGTVFKLSRAGTGWILRTIYSFQGGDDGANPYAGVVFGPDGALYGTTSDSGDPEDYPGTNHDGTCGTCGQVFRLAPPSHACVSFSCPWTKTVLYRFTAAGGDGAYPGYGNLTFDAAGNIYGTTTSGGGDGGNCDPYNNCGVVFKLTRSGESWTESVLYSFSQTGNAGIIPESGVVLDSAGNVYGTTFLGGPGGSGGGAAYQLTRSGSSWTLTVLHDFGESNDGGNPFGGMIIDQQGNLYGTTGDGPGSNDGGTVFEFQPSGDSWTYSTLAVLPADAGPEDTPIMDAAGNLYATGVGGIVFKLTHSGGVWTYNLLHDLNGQPIGGVVVDANGNLYGTTEDTSGSAWGEVWELTP